MTSVNDLQRLPKAILFDLDDTIITFDAVGDRAWMEVCEACCRKNRQLTPQSLFDRIVEVRDWYWSDPVRNRDNRMDLLRARRRIVALAFEKLGLDDPALATELADAYSVRREELIGPIPGAIETLAQLQKAGVPMALVTNGSAQGQRRKIERFGLGSFFKTLLIEGEQGIGKPDEEIYRRALRVLGLKGTEVWFVGDNLEWDVAAPQRLGIFGIWNDYARRGLPASAGIVPDRIINSIAELAQDLALGRRESQV